MTPQLTRWLPALLLLAAAFFVGPAKAAVTLRIEAAPVTQPIQVFVTVTDSAGAPVANLDANAFRVALDDTLVTSGITFTRPPSADPNQKVSVVFVMDYSKSVVNAALTAMQDSVISFINSMHDGDYAAIVKFNGTNPMRASVVQQFTRIEVPAGAGVSALTGAVMAPYDGDLTNLMDGLNVALNQFITPPVTLPPGPKAIIAVTDGLENASTTPEGAVIDSARANSIPIFTIGVTATRNTTLLTRLPTLTGGEYIAAPTGDEIAAAYTRISDRLKNEYLLTVPSTITDCNSHEMRVRVQNDPAKTGISTFARCSAPPPPPPPPPSGGGGGGGGALGVAEFLPGLLALLARRRWRWTVRV
jgi:VWFA-related protein